jgi:gamma-D-glutamyl-L-lysine dipeptidyl-peptidase
MYGVCNLSIVPCRKESSDRSEMVTQLLFGDSFQLLEETEKWALIKISHDGYECWVDKKQFSRISESQYNEHIAAAHPIATEAVSIISVEGSNQVIPIVLGSSLPFLKNGKCRIGDTTYTFEGPSVIAGKTSRNALVENALLYLNSPYLWGGRSPFGIDCSGFSQIVYKLSGLQILRDASEQASQGRALSFVEEAQPGDLAFFDNDEGRIVHVGIMLSTEQIVHASGKVRIDLLDHNGIYNNELKKYTHRLRVLKSYL